MDGIVARVGQARLVGLARYGLSDGQGAACGGQAWLVAWRGLSWQGSSDWRGRCWCGLDGLGLSQGEVRHGPVLGGSSVRWGAGGLGTDSRHGQERTGRDRLVGEDRLGRGGNGLSFGVGMTGLVGPNRRGTVCRTGQVRSGPARGGLSGGSGTEGRGSSDRSGTARLVDRHGAAGNGLGSRTGRLATGWLVEQMGLGSARRAGQGRDGPGWRGKSGRAGAVSRQERDRSGLACQEGRVGWGRIVDVVRKGRGRLVVWAWHDTACREGWADAVSRQVGVGSGWSVGSG